MAEYSADHCQLQLDIKLTDMKSPQESCLLFQYAELTERDWTLTGTGWSQENTNQQIKTVSVCLIVLWVNLTKRVENMWLHFIVVNLWISGGKRLSFAGFISEFYLYDGGVLYLTPESVYLRSETMHLHFSCIHFEALSHMWVHLCHYQSNPSR